MGITSMAQRLFTLHRRTSILVSDQILSATDGAVTIDRQSSHGVMLEFAVTSGTTYGTITVSGDISGVPDTEVITFTQNGIKLGVKRWDAGTITVARAGWGGTGRLTVSAVGTGGSPVHESHVIATGLKAFLQRGKAGWPNPKFGGFSAEKTWIALDYTTAVTPRRGDVLVDQGTAEEWFVEGAPDLLGSMRPHHWEIVVRAREGSTET